MPPPKSKDLIIKKIQTERKRLDQNLAGLTREAMLLPGVIGESSVKDILAHLADWEAHMPAWMAEARRGDAVDEIEDGLDWKQFEDFNRRIHERHRSQSLDDVLVYYHETHRQFMDMVKAMPEEEMLERGRYKFIGKGAVYDWLSAYASHDRWAKTGIRKWFNGRH